ncbi:CFI-box-CTERM domain-containing protein [Aurantibacillus circumpalustris]|uniref:CFI-box-CTERM domain-containing protein n=1 Tax=Aurantibacillus circumpalustris TaxID=3036359 RepID=UPI00295B7049|nr:CFI-box-CTERM domain-containing protein [Aurantibacillus circumpalustris]
MAKRKNTPAKKTVPKKKPGIKKQTNKLKTKVAKKPLAKASSAAKKVTAKKQSAKKTKSKTTRRKPETLMCFLTTACVDYYSLSDNGYELNTLRNYRDTYLASTTEGKKLIQDYYRVSPEIVERINSDKKKNTVYEYIYAQVKISCSAIEDQKFLLAKRTYTNMVKTLMNKYDLN